MSTSQLMANKVALVTGGGGGIGSVISQRLAEAGAKVIITYRSDGTKAQAVADGLAGDGHLVVQTDVVDTPALTRLAEQVAEQYGRLDLLVNNAGMTRGVAHSDLDGLDDAIIDQIFQVNWRGAFASVRAFKKLLADGDGGVVVNISSIAGVTGNGSNVAYCASKAAMNSMTLSLARALAPQIRVVSVSPGLVDGEYARKLDPVWFNEQVETTPLKRLASPDDVADAVLSVAAVFKHTTGAIIPVDGGRPLT